MLIKFSFRRSVTKRNFLGPKNVKLISNSPLFIIAVNVITCTLVSLNTVHMFIKY